MNSGAIAKPINDSAIKPRKTNIIILSIFIFYYYFIRMYAKNSIADTKTKAPVTTTP